ncbi:MarR family winged helix-turn-helix transcriptional regulator [Deinococcus soli (ex Cha et al. 2016)]|jgi:DNA-binding MarR family transcriptional regulator|uniref:MarR family winged helix-turn-helix transcriptional regulator n=1 Tax=Deinococcus soli (ex Cha et al. 2016) TaxID=1309411 RepID=UPI00166ED24C|nr:MarR family winged helix-turn-helix transcriptional regulator [Deinococcus soli (ex Cha et al. 2016)]
MTDTPVPGAPGSLHHRAYLALQRIALHQQRQGADLLRDHGLSGPQFNVLRILRGAGEGGLTCSEISDRLLEHDPDVTRLLDRLQKAGLVTRDRDRPDRRIVATRLTDAGRNLLNRLDPPLTELHARQFAHLTDTQLRDLITLLTAVTREPEGKPQIP